jgi:uncharacterized RDD family membrane protein YckC
MTASGAPTGDDPGLEQEGIWDEAQGPAPDASTAAGGATPSAEDGLTRRLTSTTGAPGPAGLTYADVPNRIIALIIDIIVLAVTGSVLALVLFDGLVSGSGAIDSSGGQLDLVAFSIVFVLQLIVSFVYFGASWTWAGATLGMWLLGLRVGDESDGSRVSRRHAALRWLVLGVPALLASMAIYVPNALGLILSTLGSGLLLLLLVTMAQSPSRQGLHDRAAHTILVRARRRSHQT